MASAGPNGTVRLGTEVFLHAAVALATMMPDCSVDEVALDSIGGTLSELGWEFLPDKGNVAPLADADTLDPHFKAANTGAYYVKFSGTATYTSPRTGTVKSTSFSHTVVIGTTLTFDDVSITAIEVTQATQTKKGVESDMTSGAVPQIESRRTVVRVYPRATSPGSTDTVVPDVEAVLKVFDGSGTEILPRPIPIIPGQLVTATSLPLALLRSDDLSSFNFLLQTAHQAGTVRLEATVNPDRKVPELNFSNNTKAITYSYRRTNFLDLTLVPIHVKSIATDAKPTFAQMLALTSYLGRTYPLANKDIPLRLYAHDLVTKRTLASDDAWDDLLQDIEDLTDCGNWFCSLPGNPHFYGVVPLGVFVSRLGWAELDIAGDPEPTAAGVVDSPDKQPGEEIGGEVIAQEVAHNFGRKHACSGQGETQCDDEYSPIGGNIGDFGYDSLRRRLINPTAFDFMSYGNNTPAGMWIGPYTYQGLFSDFRDSLILQQPQPVREYLLVSGSASPTAGRLRPMYRVTRAIEPKPRPPGHYTVELWNLASNTLLEAFSFEPLAISHSEDAHGTFRFYLPWHADTTHVILKRSGDTVATVPVSPHTPTVTMLDPWSGTVTGEKLLHWTAVDTDGGPLTGKIDYSRDGGATWSGIATSLDASEFLVDSSRLPGSNNAFLRVLVTDGVNTGMAQTGPFIVPAKNPTAQIVPFTVAEFATGEPVILEGFASDPEDGGLTADAAISWESDRDGFLGTGGSLLTTNLSLGLHTITLAARDSGGLVGTAQITVQIVPQIPQPALPTPASPPIPAVSSPAAPAGLLLVISLAAAIVWSLRRLASTSKASRGR